MTDQQFQTIVGLLERIANASGSRVDSAGQLDDEAKAAKMECPDCGGHMTLRRSKKNGKTFAGCTSYPECNGMRWMNGEAAKRRDEIKPKAFEKMKEAAAATAATTEPQEDVPF